MAHGSMTRDLPLVRLDGFPRTIFLAVVVMAALGALLFVAALFTDADRAWQAWLFNWLFFTTVAQGAVMFAAATVITKAVWARPIRRISLSFVAFLPVAFLLYLPLAFVGESLFPWTDHMYHEGMEVWLNTPFVAARNIVLLGALFGLSVYFAYLALRPDAGLYRDEMPERLRGLYGRLSQGWRGQEQEEFEAWRKLNIVAPILGLVWAVAISMVAWDYVMSLEAGWFSTMIGPYVFMGGFLGGVAATAILAVTYRSHFALDGVIEPPHLHDLGKLTFAFCVFWAYLFWSQYIVIWYGMLPWEQTWMVHRFTQPFVGLSVLVLFLIFVAPFASLLGVRAKKNPHFLATVASVVLFGLWLERYMLVYPALYPGADLMPFSWPEVGVGLLFAALFVASVTWFATTFPILQTWQPAVAGAMFDEERTKDELGAPGRYPT
ncbi:MAG TPA: hypothetical protein VMK65_10000 [Longimicrobiales bacterium]|nr:hypothetical protein [Longimicrobiales bacterium]